jgi:DNA-binding XRE family transcriptional regulator
MSRADLSAASGLHRTTIARIEDGQANPRFETLMALWRGLGSLADVFALSERGSHHQASGHASQTRPGARGNPLGLSVPSSDEEV